MSADHLDKNRCSVDIIATIGPSSNDKNTMVKLIKSGANIFRINLSHQTLDGIDNLLNNISNASTEVGNKIPIALDTAGPETRIVFLGKSYKFKKDKIIEILFVECKSDYLNDTFKSNLVYNDTLCLDDDIYIGDEGVRGKIIKIDLNKSISVLLLEDLGVLKRMKCRIASYKFGENLTKNDKVLISYVMKIRKVDFIYLSFVNNMEDLKETRKVYDGCKIIAKIETKEAVENINDLLEYSEGIMIARGDLGVSVGFQKMFSTQYNLLKFAKNNYVIMATQCLLSMVTNRKPTRAEITDLGNAVVSNVSGIMLSEETAIGKNPIECTKVLRIIIEDAKSCVDE